METSVSKYGVACQDGVTIKVIIGFEGGQTGFEAAKNGLPERED
jgi:hypothetical protein